MVLSSCCLNETQVRISDGAMDLFGIVVEQLKSVGGRRNKISLLDPRETLGKVGISSSGLDKRKNTLRT